MQSLQLLALDDPARPVAYRSGGSVSFGQFCEHVQAIAQRLPPGNAMLNLCEDRYRFLVSYAAALAKGQAVLMPPTRAEQIVSEIASSNRGSYRWQDSDLAAVRKTPAAQLTLASRIPAEQTVMIGFTSGSTGAPKAHPKLWRSMHGSTARNAAAIREALGIADADKATAIPAIVATVPPQHMYGMELSILLPLIGGMAVHAARPLFPADIARSLAELPAPRVLVSTPLHLRTLVESSQSFPTTALIVSATAPLDQELAAAVEARLGGKLLELFGSTETCVFASRRTATGEPWRTYEGVELHPRAEGTLVVAPWFADPVLLQDVVELLGDGKFVVRGRSSDMIEVAGKRASLADLTQRLLAVEGVRDAVLFQPQPDSVATIRRLAALVVAPGCSAQQIRDRLAESVDPAFLPRPLRMVEALPRNELGKLPREKLVELLREKEESG